MIVTNKIVIVKNESLVNPNLHDACVIGLIMLNNKKLLLPMLTPDQTAICIALNDIDCLRVDDFREGNIILDITVSSGTEVNHSDIAYAHGLEEFLSDKSNTYLDKALQNFFTSGKLFIQINPSYGCKLVCVCRTIEIVDDWISLVTESGTCKPGR